MNVATDRSLVSLIGDAFSLYARYPLLFVTLAALVIVPYQLLVLLATGAGPVELESVDARAGILLSTVDWALVVPLVSALHVHAVADVKEDKVPRLGSVSRRSLAALPVVAAASVMSGLGILLGFVALIIPGIYLLLRWALVAQAAAIERNGWENALRRSGELMRGFYWRVLGFLLLLGVLATVPFIPTFFLFDEEGTTAVSFLVGVFLEVVTWSFVALGTALLYFDLRGRGQRSLAAMPPPAPYANPPASPQSPVQPASEHDLDPRVYTDQERPAGWYVDPHAPHRMRYWTGSEQSGWSPKTARTPGKTRRAWDRRWTTAKPPAPPTPPPPPPPPPPAA